MNYDRAESGRCGQLDPHAVDEQRPDVIDRRAPRIDWERINRGPSPADLRDIPETHAADWKEAELLVPIDEETYREFQRFLAERRKSGKA